MNMFEINPVDNLLPGDDIVYYFGKVINEHAPQCYLDALPDTSERKNDKVIIFGKHITAK